MMNNSLDQACINIIRAENTNDTDEIMKYFQQVSNGDLFDYVKRFKRVIEDDNIIVDHTKKVKSADVLKNVKNNEESVVLKLREFFMEYNVLLQNIANKSVQVKNQEMLDFFRTKLLKEAIETDGKILNVLIQKLNVQDSTDENLAILSLLSLIKKYYEEHVKNNEK